MATAMLGLLYSLSLHCSNPLADPGKSDEEFKIYLTDFTTASDGGARQALLEMIAKSKTSLHCAFSALTLNDVTNALIARARSGIQVKVAFDSDVQATDPGSLALEASGAFMTVTTPRDSKQSQLFYGNGGNAAMRHNFCLADERSIYISTAAADDTQMRMAPAVALRITAPRFGIARDFLRESNMFSQLLFGDDKGKTDFMTKFTALDQVMGAYWGPQEDPLDTLAESLAEAGSSVDFYATSFQSTNSGKADLDLPQTLRRLEAAKGLSLRKYFSTAALFDTASKAFTLNAPAQYVNSHVTIGTNIFVIDRGLPSARSFIYTGSLRSQANSADDSVLLEFRGKFAAEILGAYLDKIGSHSAAVDNAGDTGAFQDIVISEIHWAGSYSNALEADSGDEFIELYNRSGRAINVSGWKFACTTNNGAAVNSYITLPGGAVIAPGAYFVVAAQAGGAISSADYYNPALSITNSAHECKLTDGKTSTSEYSGEPGFTGSVVDTAGSPGSLFDATTGMGINDTQNKIRRSMERVDYNAPGNNTTNWRTNNNSLSNNNSIAAGFRNHTFASPGSAGAAAPVLFLTTHSFETDTNTCTVAARDAANNVTSLTGTCPTGWTISIASANGVAFGAASGNTPAGGGTNYSSLSSLTSTYAAREIRTTECRPLNKGNPLDISGWYLKDTINSAQIRHLMYYYTDASCTALAGGTNPTVFTGQSVTAQNTWENKTNQVTTGAYPSETTLYIRLGVQAQRTSGGNIRFDLISLAN